jgi:hypothetical protein
MIICTELGQGGHELLTLLAAHASKPMDCSTGVEPADQSCLGKIYQCGGNREIPRFCPTALDIAQTPPRLPLRISEIMPATAPRAARGRADAAEAAGCTIVATAKLAPLSLKIYPPPSPPPHFLSNNRPLPTTPTLLAGAFWPRRLIWWVTGIFEYCEKIKYEIANLLVMVIKSLRSFSSNPTAEDQTKVMPSSS